MTRSIISRFAIATCMLAAANPALAQQKYYIRERIVGMPKAADTTVDPAPTPTPTPTPATTPTPTPTLGCQAISVGFISTDRDEPTNVKIAEVRGYQEFSVMKPYCDAYAKAHPSEKGVCWINRTSPAGAFWTPAGNLIQWPSGGGYIGAALCNR